MSNRTQKARLRRDIGNNRKQYYKYLKYPTIPPSVDDVYITTSVGDRLDLLAFRFYGDVTLYWIIALANPNIVGFGTLFIPRGSQLRIPIDISDVIDAYNRINGL